LSGLQHHPCSTGLLTTNDSCMGLEKYPMVSSPKQRSQLRLRLINVKLLQARDFSHESLTFIIIFSIFQRAHPLQLPHVQQLLKIVQPHGVAMRSTCSSFQSRYSCSALSISSA